ncbi:MAG: sodium/proton-translocating pyrophosphatase, partial [Firmicutes bacterium]|nr:sodium/proton-translocating pyrophosphatase [Bacillota bacterium]
MNWFVVSVIVSILAFGVATWFYFWVKKQPSNNQEILMIGQLIQEGANTFLSREYRALTCFVLIAAIIIFLFLPQPLWQGNLRQNLMMALAYIAGSVFSGMAGKIGIKVATIANVRCAQAAVKGLKPSFMVGFKGGAVMGMAVVGASLLGVTIVM